MLPEIKQLIALLGSENLLEKRETRDALKNLARSLDDEYYRDSVLGETAVQLAQRRCWDEAEEMTLLAEGAKRARYLREVADIEGESLQTGRALGLYRLAKEAVLAREYSPGLIHEVEEIGKSLTRLGKLELAREAWETAVRLAQPEQDKGGYWGRESCGVLLSAAEALCRMGDLKRAQEIADLISLEYLRDRAQRLLGSYEAS